MKGTRLFSIDALRGLAAVLMVQQHLGIWLVDAHRYSTQVRAGFAYINMTGGAAAPLFVTLAGVSSVLSHNKGISALELVKRGVMLLCFGVLLNLMTPSWFGWGSFYILHLLGVWTLISPLMLRLSSPLLMGSAALILGLSVVGQSFLETPLALTNAMMANTNRPWGVLRVALIEGQFPIFPWLALAVGGVWAGRALIAKQTNQLIVAGVSCASLACLLRGVVFLVPGAATQLPWRAVCRAGTSFFPMSTIYALGLFSLCLLLLVAFSEIEKRRSWETALWLVYLGRSSLTLLVVHVVVFRQGLIALERYKTMSPLVALGLILIFLGMWTTIVSRWSAVDFKYGLEWVLRLKRPATRSVQQ